MNKNIQKLSVEEKSLMLANLMGWEPDHDDPNYYWVKEFPVMLCMYEDNPEGLAQFAAILLKFPESVSGYARKCERADFSGWFGDSSTQENLLDEILQMNEVVV